MSRLAFVLRTVRSLDETGHGLDVVCDPGGGDNVTAPHCAGAGDDAVPLPGDYVALTDSSGTGAEQAVGYCDTRHAGKAKPGERRMYARDLTGAVKIDLWLKADGSLVIDNGSGKVELQTGGDVVINGVVISKSGAIAAPGEVTALSKTTAISLSKHTHPTAAPGAASAPVPFPYVPPTP